MPTTNRSQNSQTAVNSLNQPTNDIISGLFKHPCIISLQKRISIFWNFISFISVILDRGNKLRNAMVISALKSDTDSAAALKDTPLPLPKDNIQPLPKLVLKKKIVLPLSYQFTFCKTFFFSLQALVFSFWDVSWKYPSHWFNSEALWWCYCNLRQWLGRTCWHRQQSCGSGTWQVSMFEFISRCRCTMLYFYLKFSLFSLFFKALLLLFLSGMDKAPALILFLVIAVSVAIASSMIHSMIRACWKICSTKLL